MDNDVAVTHLTPYIPKMGLKVKMQNVVRINFLELYQDEQAMDTKFEYSHGKNGGESITWIILKEDEAIPDDPSEWNHTKKPLDDSPINVNIECDKNSYNVDYNLIFLEHFLFH